MKMKWQSFIVPLRKEFKASLTKQGMQNMNIILNGLHRRRLAKKEKSMSC